MIQNISTIRVVASMTTIPSRIEFIRPVLEAVLAQTVPIEHVEVNIPYESIRFGMPYSVPTWLAGMDRVKIFRTDDYGPITKIAPTLLRYMDDNETYLWSVDDDCAYPPNQLELLCRVHNPDRRRILTRYGGTFADDGTPTSWYGESKVTFFEGFGGVLYPPACVDRKFLDFLNITSGNSECRKNDDVVLSLYFSYVGLTMYLYNRPSEDEPYMVQGWLSHVAKKDPLLPEEGYVETYKRIFAFVKSIL